MGSDGNNGSNCHGGDGALWLSPLVGLPASRLLRRRTARFSGPCAAGSGVEAAQGGPDLPRRSEETLRENAMAVAM